MLQNITPSSLISRLQEVSNNIETLKRKREELSKPILSDRTSIPHVLEAFKTAMAQIGKAYDSTSAYQRRQVVFILLTLYAPHRLVGGKMPSGLRKELGKAMPEVKPCTLSADCEVSVFWYQTYREFAEEVDRMYRIILESIR